MHVPFLEPPSFSFVNQPYRQQHIIMAEFASAESGQTTHRAKCLCESIAFEMKGEPSKVIVCHCANCKQSSGSAFMVDAFFNEKVRV